MLLTEFAPAQSEAELQERHLGYFAAPGIQSLIFTERADVLENPGKGWVIHYYDNTLAKYGDRLGADDLADFPGFTVVYLRLAWCHLEPREGEYNWEIIDAPIRRWTALGKKIALRITCCESGHDQPFATPEWVRAAGAAGSFFDDGRQWEPDYGDPVFLDKLGRFLEVLARRYDGQPWLDFVDMGSYGVWGEWHTSSSSRRAWPVAVLKRHVDLHAACFRHSRLLILYGAGREVCDYARETAAAGLRCDSVGVHSYYTEFGGYWTEEIDPDLDAGRFGDFWRGSPVVLEPAHYSHALRYNTWQNGATLERALDELHPSWVTVHHWPREWLAENRELAARLANRMGYWFFLKTLALPEKVRRGDPFLIRMVWENRGVAPIYRAYALAISLRAEAGGAEVYRSLHPSVDIRQWQPGRMRIVASRWRLPEALPPGRYALRIGLVDGPAATAAAIRLGITGEDDDLFYQAATLTVE